MRDRFSLLFCLKRDAYSDALMCLAYLELAMFV
jgi:hypothetical protein